MEGGSVAVISIQIFKYLLFKNYNENGQVVQCNRLLTTQLY